MTTHSDLRDQIAEPAAICSLRPGNDVAGYRDLNPIENRVLSHAGILPLLGNVPALLQQHIHIVTIRFELFLRSSAARLKTRPCLLIKISAGQLLVRLNQ